MKSKLEALKNNYITIRKQARLMAITTSNSEDVIKLEPCITTFNLVIEDLEKILSEEPVKGEKVCNCGNPSGEGDIQMANDEDLLYFCCDCGKKLQNDC